MPSITQTYINDVYKNIENHRGDSRVSNKIILKLICDGKTSEEIGKEVFVSSRTIEGRVLEMMKLMRCKNRIELAVTAIRIKLVEYNEVFI